ncbi:hypothetical protein [Plantibacter flavus]|uniref:hypothetical protein n=1 Tax=Plantibacter flavus TaxID=150123 RepID=UPI003393AE6E
MSDSLTPSEWFNGHFGEHSLSVMKGLVAAGRSAHERSLEAKAGSGLRTNDAYGASFWLALPEEIVAELAFLPGAEIVRPSRGRYELIIFENALVFPSRIGGDSAAPDTIKLRPSKVRHEMFSLEDRVNLDETLDFEGLDYEEEAQGPRYVADFGSATSLIFIAYDCSARGGLQHVYIGDATLQDDGTVFWLYREELPLVALADDVTTLTLVDETIAPRFDDSIPPMPALELRRAGETAEDEERTDPAIKEEKSGTEDDERE